MIACWLFAHAQLDAPRVSLARVEITAPCAGLPIELEGAGKIELGFGTELSAGERRTVALAVPLPSVTVPTDVWSRSVAQALAATGYARLISLEPAVDLAGVNPELLARPRPVLAVRGAALLPWSALFVLGAALAITLTHRRRVLIATAIALLASASVFVLARNLGGSALSAVRMIEARFDQAPGGAWLAVESRRNILELADLAHSRIEVTPPSRLIECRSGIEPPAYALSSWGATFVGLHAVDPGTRRLSRALNAFASFDAAWLREADGAWLSLGPWKIGEPLPAGRAGEPPGWLVPALPMGTSIFIGRLGEGQFHAFDGDDAPPTWMHPLPWVRGLGL